MLQLLWCHVCSAHRMQKVSHNPNPNPNIGGYVSLHNLHLCGPHSIYLLSREYPCAVIRPTNHMAGSSTVISLTESTWRFCLRGVTWKLTTVLFPKLVS